MAELGWVMWGALPRLVRTQLSVSGVALTDGRGVLGDRASLALTPWRVRSTFTFTCHQPLPPWES